MKANYREEFLAASMTLDMGNTDKLALFAAEAKKSGIEVKPPCVNASEVDFLAEAARASAETLGAIRYSLAALKNIGAAAVATIVAERDEHRDATRALPTSPRASTPRRLNKRGIETLAAAGAFDALEANRALVARQRRGHPGAGAAARGEHGRRAPTTSSVSARPRPQLDLRPAQAWTPMERLAPRVRGGRLLSLRPPARQLRARAAASSASSATPSSRR